MGVLIEWQYPYEVKMTIGELLAIYTSQTMGNTSLPRFATFSSDKMQIASYFGGDIHKDMIILFLDETEEPKAYKDALITFYHNVIDGDHNVSRLELKFQEYFSKIEEHQQQNVAILTSIDQKFEATLDLFKDLIQLLDSRMTKLENNILSFTSSKQKGE